MSAERESQDGYPGPLGLLPVPYSEGIFNFHWFNFYNAICFQIIVGAPIVLLAKDLGANSVILGLIASCTPLMTVLQVPAARYLGKYSYRSFALLGLGVRSIFIAMAALVPILCCFSREVRLGWLLASLFFFNVLRGISTAVFLPWITNLVSAPIRGRFISIDHIFINTGSLAAMILSALLMRGHSEPWRYSLVIWCAVIGAVIALFYMRHIPDIREVHASQRSSESVSLGAILRLAPFRNWIIFNLCFVMASGGMSVFSVEYLRVQAHFSPSLIYAVSACTFVGPMVILQWLGMRIDRVGSIPFIRASISIFALALILWFAMSAGVIAASWWMVLLLNFLSGAALAGFNVSNSHLWMAVVPESGKNHYFAIATVITSAGAGIAPLFWGWVLDALGGLDFVEGPFHLRRHSIYFLGTFILSLLAVITSYILEEPGRKIARCS